MKRTSMFISFITYFSFGVGGVVLLISTIVLAGMFVNGAGMYATSAPIGGHAGLGNVQVTDESLGESVEYPIYKYPKDTQRSGWRRITDSERGFEISLPESQDIQYRLFFEPEGSEWVQNHCPYGYVDCEDIVTVNGIIYTVSHHHDCGAGQCGTSTKYTTAVIGGDLIIEILNYGPNECGAFEEGGIDACEKKLAEYTEKYKKITDHPDVFLSTANFYSPELDTFTYDLSKYPEDPNRPGWRDIVDLGRKFEVSIPTLDLPDGLIPYSVRFVSQEDPSISTKTSCNSDERYCSTLSVNGLHYAVSGYGDACGVSYRYITNIPSGHLVVGYDFTNEECEGEYEDDSRYFEDNYGITLKEIHVLKRKAPTPEDLLGTVSILP